METMYGLQVLDVNGMRFAVASLESECDKAVAECVAESLWAFSPDFIAECVGLDEDAKQCISFLQDEKCEMSNSLIASLVGGGMKMLVKKAVELDGRGHFLSPYDGRERDFRGDVDPSNPPTGLIARKKWNKDIILCGLINGPRMNADLLDEKVWEPDHPLYKKIAYRID